MKTFDKLCSLAGGNVALLAAVAVVSSAATGITAAAAGYIDETTLMACAVPDAGVLYRTTMGSCEEPDHVAFELPTSEFVTTHMDSVTADLTSHMDSVLQDALAEVKLYDGNHNVEYVLDEASVSAHGEVSLFAGCPETKYPVGGGFEKLGGVGAEWISSYPDIVGGVWGWAATVRAGEDGFTAQVIATCSEVGQTPQIP